MRTAMTGALCAGVLLLAGFSTSAGADRSFVTTGLVRMTVERPERVAVELRHLVEDMGGSVEPTRRDNAGQPGASATLVLRIQPAEVMSLVDRLDDYGTVESVTVGQSDVSAEVRDLTLRIHALETSVERREASLADQSELESLLARQAALAEQVAMSTLQVELWAAGALPEPEPVDLGGWDAFLPVVGALVAVLVSAALIGVIVIAVVRSGRRRAETAPPAAHPPAPPEEAASPHPGAEPPA